MLKALICFYVVFCLFFCNTSFSQKLYSSDLRNTQGFFERESAILNCTKYLKSLVAQSQLGNAKKIVKKRSKYFMNNCFYFNRNVVQKKYRYLLDVIEILGPNYFFQFIYKVNIYKNLLSGKNKVISRDFPGLFKAIKACHNLNLLTKKFFYGRKYAKDVTRGDEEERDEEKFQTFYLWIKQNGVKFNKLDIYVDPQTGIRGLYAIEDYSFNENLIYVPDNMLLTLLMAESSKVGKKLRKYSDKIPYYDSVLMTVFIIEEALKKNSFWKPFIELLPGDFSTFPIFYNDKELELLKGYKLHEDLLLVKKDLRKYYEYVCLAAKEVFVTDYCGIVTYEIFLWAFTNVKSRAFSYNKDGLELMTLTPFADLINHDMRNYSFLWRYSSNYKGFIIYSVRNGEVGKEIFLSYGSYGTEDILKNYGFITQNNPKDSIYMDFGLDPDDPQFYIKYRLLKKNSIKNNLSLPLMVDVGDDKTLKFFNLFRFFTYKGNLNKYLKTFFNIEEENENIEDKNKKVKAKKKYQATTHKFNKNVLSVDYLFNNIKDEHLYKFNPKHFTSVDIKDEKLLFVSFRKLLESKLKSFKDEELMKRSDELYKANKLTANERNIYLYKLSQKGVLNFYLKLCDIADEIFDMHITRFNAYLQKNREEIRPYDFYLYNTAYHLIQLYNS